MLKLYENIRDLRKLNKWTQEELAHKMGYTDRSMIAKIESGKVDLSQSKIVEFANVFGVKAGDLMGWDDNVLIEKEQRDTEQAIKLYQAYLKAIPEVQEAVERLLKSDLSDS